MNRNAFRFTYSSADLMAACQKIIDHSNDRLVHWQGRYEAAKKDVESQTVKVKVITHQVTGGERASVSADIDRGPEVELNLAQAKLEHHREQVETYDRWRRGFLANPDASFELDPEDIAFFRL